MLGRIGGSLPLWSRFGNALIGVFFVALLAASIPRTVLAQSDDGSRSDEVAIAEEAAFIVDEIGYRSWVAVGISVLFTAVLLGLLWLASHRWVSKGWLQLILAVAAPWALLAGLTVGMTSPLLDQRCPDEYGEAGVTPSIGCLPAADLDNVAKHPDVKPEQSAALGRVKNYLSTNRSMAVVPILPPAIGAILVLFVVGFAYWLGRRELED